MSFESEFAEHVPFLRALARRLATDASTADDLVQETFTAALTTAPQTPGLAPWLFAVLRKRGARRMRGEMRRRTREQAAAHDPASPSTADVAAKLDVARRLLQHIESLDAGQRDAIFLRFYEDLMPRQIAARLAIPLGTVKTRLARALAQLRLQLDADHPDGRQHWLPALCAIGGLDRAGALPGGVAAGRRAAGLRNLLVVAGAMLTAAVVVASFGLGPGNPPPARTTVADTAAPTPAAPTPGDREQPPGPPPAAILGRVEDADFGIAPGDGRPAGNVVARCTVRPAPTADGERQTIEIAATTDARGAFQVVLPQGATLLTVAAEGTASLRGARWYASATAALPADIVLTRYPRGRVEGLAIDPTGLPVGGAHVTLGHWQGSERVTIATTADASGRFVFPAPAVESWLAAERDGFVEVGASTLRELPRGGWQEARIVLAPAGTLIVDTVGADGGPVPDVRRIAVSLDAVETGLVAAFDFAGASFRRSEPVVRGRATLPVPSGLRLRLLAGETQFAREQDGCGVSLAADGQVGQPITVEAGTRHVLRLVLHGIEVRGTVLDPDGAGVAGADVYAASVRDGRLAPIRMETADAHGAFAFRLTPDTDTQVLHLSAIGHGPYAALLAERWLRLDQPAPALELRLAQAQRLVGRVRDANGTPLVAQVRCTLTLANHADAIYGGEVTTDANGAFSLHSTPGTIQRLEVSSAEFAAVVCADARPGTPIDVVLDRPKAARIRLRPDATGPVVTALEVRIARLDATGGGAASWPVLGDITSWSVAAPTPLPAHSTSQHLVSPEGTWHTEVLRLAPQADAQGTYFEFRSDAGPAAISIGGRGRDDAPLSRVTTGPIAIPTLGVDVPFSLSPTTTCRGRIEFGANTPRFAACVGLADDHGHLLIVGQDHDNGIWQTNVEASTPGHFTLADVPVGVWELQVGTRAELERRAPRLRQRVVVGPYEAPIAVRL